MRARSLLLASLVLLAVALPSFATPIAFNVSGTTSGGAVSAIVTFDSIGSNLTIQLENTTAGVAAIAQVLDGLSFSLPGSSLTLASVSFGSQTGAGLEFCSGTSHSVTCTDSGTAVSSPYGWTLSGGLLAAGAGSFKPYGIINESVDSAPCTTNCDGIGNAQHNPYLIDPIFTFTGTGINLANLGPIDLPPVFGPVMMRVPAGWTA